MLLLKILAMRSRGYKLPLFQNELAVQLCYSASEVNEGFKRLLKAGLLREGFESSSILVRGRAGRMYEPVLSAVEEFLIYGLKYVFPVTLGEYTRGIPTAFAAPVFKGKVVIGNDPIPVWPYPDGKVQGLALAPLYSSIPESITKHPDQPFYDLLAVVDVLRQGRARERDLAIQMLSLWLPTREHQYAIAS